MKNQRMMRHDQLRVLPDRLLDDRIRYVERKQAFFHSSIGVTEQKAGIVKIHLQIKGRHPAQGLVQFTYRHQVQAGGSPDLIPHMCGYHAAAETQSRDLNEALVDHTDAAYLTGKADFADGCEIQSERTVEKAGSRGQDGRRW